uniref:Transposase Tnp1/En/Spm-like domain-containing protein n=1 Tax=Arundo donax TaxID=35708 RepID=A0A0A9ASZ2_ARUDO
MYQLFTEQKTSQWYLQCAHGAEKHAINQSCSKAAKIGGEGLRGAITSTNGTIKKSKVTTTTNETIQVGKVFLQATTRPYSHVAKATVEGGDLSELIGGVQLGSQCYKVVIYSAICRDANLFRSHKNLRRIGDAVGHSIAWPSQWCKKFHQSRSLGK